MASKTTLSGECDAVVFRLYREKDDKYSVRAHLEGKTFETPAVLDIQQITERRSLVYAIQELVDAAYSIEIAINRGHIKVIP